LFTRVKNDKEIERMRISGKLLATVHAVLKEALQPGMTTQDLADIARRELRGTGGDPAFYNYHGFPDVLCVSVNDEVVHGIPNHDRVIQEGDIVSMDFGVNYEGMITDSAISKIAGDVATSEDEKLLEVTYKSMMAGFAQLKDRVRVGDISNSIEKYVDGRYGIVRDLVGHGVGHQLHEEPNIPNYGQPNKGSVLSAGMTIAIEPMLNLGGPEVFIEDDGWTVRTRDGSRSAHFEHTVLITEKGHEILTIL
jgi:methionyl aminopeptidase